jgi:hypothetical protein
MTTNGFKRPIFISQITKNCKNDALKLLSNNSYDLLINVAALNKKKLGGSLPGKRPNINRDREAPKNWAMINIFCDSEHRSILEAADMDPKLGWNLLQSSYTFKDLGDLSSKLLQMFATIDDPVTD